MVAEARAVGTVDVLSKPKKDLFWKLFSSHLFKLGLVSRKISRLRGSLGGGDCPSVKMSTSPSSGRALDLSPSLGFFTQS